ncbi:MAG: PadR family transcriptional regulator [Acidimicrobiales bacterium]
MTRPAGPATTSRARIVEYLAFHGGEVSSADGRSLTRAMAKAVGYRDQGALNAMLGRLEGEGVIAREVRGRRTYRIALTAPPGSVPGGSGGEPVDPPQLQRFADDLASPRGMLRATLLLVLAERPGHGFDLNERLKPYGLGAEDPSPVYRALHWLERSELVQSSWEIRESGPARRVYALTSLGREALELAAGSLRERRGLLDEQLGRYLEGRADPGLEEPRRAFEVLVEAKLSVTAADEASARTRVEGALAEGRALGEGVVATGKAWVYGATEAHPDVA